MSADTKLASGRAIAERWYRHGRELALSGRYKDALEPLERALAYSVDETDLGFLARVRSWLGVSIAMTGGSTARARNLCEEAVYVRSRDAELYVNLGHVLLRCERRDLAMACVEAALAIDSGNGSAHELKRRFGQRRAPVFRFLDRSNPINKYAGILRHRLES